MINKINIADFMFYSYQKQGQFENKNKYGEGKIIYDAPKPKFITLNSTFGGKVYNIL